MDAVNPFTTSIDVSQSSYYGMTQCMDGKVRLQNLVTGKEAGSKLYFLHHAIEGMVNHKNYPCPGPPRVFAKRQERLLIYDSIKTCDIKIVAHDLYEFILEYRKGGQGNDLTGILIFSDEPKIEDVVDFRKSLWQFLMKVASESNLYFPWADGYSPVLKDKNFAMSFAGVALFLAAFHPASPRSSRKFAYPTLIINPHEQFEQLKKDGYFEKWKKASRDRDILNDGCINPELNDFGDKSEAGQYDSANIGEVCPFASLWQSKELKNYSESRCPITKATKAVKNFCDMLLSILHDILHRKIL